MALKNYGAVTSLEELASLCQRLHFEREPFGFDIESGYVGEDREKASLHPETAILVGVSLTNSGDWARYLPLGHDHGPNLDNIAVARLLWPLLNTGLGIAHNALFELRHLSKWFRETLSDDIEFGDAVRASNGYFPIRSDSMIEAYLACEYEAGGNTVVGLKPLVKLMFNHEMVELFDLFPGLPVNKRKCLRFNPLDPQDPKVINYACEDALWCLKVHQHYYERIRHMLLYKVEMAIVTDCLPAMEDFGIRYDWEFLRRAGDDLREFRTRFNAEIMAELSQMTGETTAINLGSPLQLSDVLYTKLGMRTNVYTKSTQDLPKHERKMSTGKIALAGLAKEHPVVRKILAHKEMTKLLSSYLDKYEHKFGYAEDGMVHPSHSSAVIVTGRFATSDPNYTQSPKTYHFDLAEAAEAHARHVEAHGKKCACDQFQPPPGTCFRFNFRDAIVAPPEHYLLGFDLSQAELRGIAGFAQETALLQAFERGEDVHTLTASLIFGIPLDEVTKEQRDVGKTFNFALLYGMGVKSMADRLGITEAEAEVLYDKYFAGYPGIATWTAQQVQLGRRQGYVESKFGRRLPIWEYRSDKRWIRNKGDRACVNYPVQGSATGDYVKIGMVRVVKALRNAGLRDKVRLVMNVHDALEFAVHRSVHPAEVIKVLEPAVIFPVNGWPAMKADWHIGKKWGSPVEVELRDDGQLVTKGEKEIEIKPAVEVDEETGEEFEVLPEVDVEVLRQAVEPAPAPAPSTEDGKRVVIELRDMPDLNAWAAFNRYLDAHPGPNRLTLLTAEGEMDLDHYGSHAVDPSHAAQVSLILGPVTIRYDARDVNAEDLLYGLEF